MANTISQIAINGITYDIRDANIHNTVNDLSSRVAELSNNEISVFLDSEDNNEFKFVFPKRQDGNNDYRIYTLKIKENGLVNYGYMSKGDNGNDKWNELSLIRTVKVDKNNDLGSKVTDLSGSVYQFGPLVVGRLLIKDENANNRPVDINSQNYTLITGLPTPSQKIWIEGVDEPGKNVRFVLEADGKLRWTTVQTLRSTEWSSINFIYSTLETN